MGSHSLFGLVLPISNQNRSQSIDACRYFDRNRAGEIRLTAPSEIQLEKVTQQRWRILGLKVANPRVDLLSAIVTTFVKEI